MINDNLYEPYQIVLKEQMDKCPRPEHKHSFFEIVYIVSGTGRHYINTTSFTYTSGHMFLLTPEDSHHFDVAEPTQFLFIRFNDLYIQSGKLKTDTLERLQFILKNANHEPGCVLKNESDKMIVRPVMEAIIREHTHHHLYDRELIEQYVNTLIIMVARNIAISLPEQVSESTEVKALDILQYIQSNIRHPEKIRAEHISREFGISESYLGRYFKKHAHETLQKYVTNYKLHLIENRLLHSDMRVTEIAQELGFTDESHLNRIFKKHKGMSPSGFRRMQRSDIAVS